MLLPQRKYQVISTFFIRKSNHQVFSNFSQTLPWAQRFSFFCFSILSCEAAKTSRKAVEATRRSSSEEDNKENLWDQGTKTQAKKIGQLFQVSNHFHPHHLHIIMLSVHWFRVFFLTKPDHFFLFPLMQICFLAFRIVTKNR